MQAISRVLLLGTALLVCGRVSSAGILFDIQDLGQDQFKINYSVSGIDFLKNHELELQFDPALYLDLTNGVAPAGFNVMLFQPNNPGGTAGRYSALALVDHPDLSSGFSVNVRTIAFGRPGAQLYKINQLDDAGFIVATLATGDTSAAAVPEPSTLSAVGITLLVAGGGALRRRRLKKTG